MKDHWIAWLNELRRERLTIVTYNYAWLCFAHGVEFNWEWP